MSKEHGLELLKKKGFGIQNKNRVATKILAVDPAEKTGWAVSKNEYGLWNLKPGRDESFSYKLLKFKSRLKEIIEMESITLVVYERPSGHHANAVISHSKLVGVIELYCTENNIPFKGYSAPEIKKFATGKGNSNKEKMIAAAKQKLDYQGEDDNEADALWLWCLAASDLNL